FHEANAANADAAVDGVGRLVGKPDRRANVVAFLKTLTDDRVRFESAPFDHPQLFIPNGHPGDAAAVVNDGTGKATDALVEVPASGAAGSCVGVDGTPHFACPVCGDKKVNQASEQCDGADSARCPGRCRADCTCPAAPTPPAPRCGDDLINQASEECDGAADAACTGRCRVDCTCAPAPPSPAPRCGDNAINQPSEQCDGTDSARCPGACRADCTCPPPPPSPSGAPVGTVEADTLVNKASPAKNNGTSARLEVDASPAKHDPISAAGGQAPGTRTPPPPTTTPPPAAAPVGTVVADTSVQNDLPATNFGGKALLSVDGGGATGSGGVQRTLLRVSVSGVGARLVTGAHLKLQVANVTNAGSVRGGSIHALTSCAWDEKTVTWATQPAIDGPALATL